MTKSLEGAVKMIWPMEPDKMPAENVPPSTLMKLEGDRKMVLPRETKAPPLLTVISPTPLEPPSDSRSELVKVEPTPVIGATAERLSPPMEALSTVIVPAVWTV